MSQGDRREVLRRAEEFLGMFSKGAEFTRELLAENERLRRRIVEIEDRQTNAAQSPDEWDKLREELLGRIQSLEEEKQDVVERLTFVEAENRQFACRYVDVEEENNNLANLYISSYQLHATLDMAEVVRVILEIVINLIGVERFAIYLVDEKTNRLEPVACEGDELESFPSEEWGEGPLSEVLKRGEVECVEGGTAGNPNDPIAVIPLCIEGRAVGAIVLYRLLQQKDGFSSLDLELFTLLAGHAATSIMAARLYGESKRKLNTIQGFIDLLTK